MATVSRKSKYNHFLFFVLLFAVVILFFTNAAPPQNNPTKTYTIIKSKDALLEYINILFDTLDAVPALANKGDSLLSNLWRQPASYDEKLAWYQLLTNIAYHLLQSGQVRASTAWYEKALLFFEQQKSNKALAAEMNFEEYVTKPLGNNYTRIGDFSKAVTIQQTAIESAIENDKKEMLPGLYANLATTYFYMRDYKAVHKIINNGIEALSGRREDIAVLLYNLKSDAYLETMQMDSAVYWNNKALGYQWHSNENTVWRLNALTNKATILGASNQYAKSFGYLRQAWQIAEKASVKDKAKLSNEIGVALFKLNHPQESKQWFLQTLSFFRTDSLNLFPDYNVTTAMFGMAICAEAEQNTDSTSYWCMQAVLNDYYTQQLIDPWLYSKSNMYVNEINTESAIAWHHNQYHKTKNENFLLKAIWLAELSKGRKLTNEQHRSQQWLAHANFRNIDFEELRNDYLLLAKADSEIEKNLIKERITKREYDLSLKGKNFSQSINAPSYPKFIHWLQEKRKTHSIVSYYSSAGHLYIVQADRVGLLNKIDTVGTFASAINVFINQYFYHGPQAFNNNPDGYYKASYQLLNKFLPSIRQRDDDYIISPSDALHLLPFEALSTSAASPSYFGKYHAIAYQFSLLQLLNTPENKKSGIDVFSFEKAHLGFPALPSSRLEADFLQGHFLCKKYEAQKSDDSVFYNSLSKGNVIHLSTHVVAADSLLQPFIVLKNKVYLGQIQYNASRCPLIVLASCETGKGIAQQQEGVLSLGRTFLGKGVGGVLSTRWQIDDASAGELLRNFYTELKKVKYPAIALKNAREIYLKENQSVAAQNPWLWAAFSYQGNIAPVEIKSGTSYWIAFFLTAIIVVIAISIYVRIKNRRKNFSKLG